MSKELDLIKRQQPEIIDGFSTGNIYIGVTKEELNELEKELKEREQHKAIEQELGIDLITLVKAISNGVWVKTKNDISKHLTVALKKRHHTKEYWLFYRPYSHVYLKDYGETWALTREELLWKQY